MHSIIIITKMGLEKKVFENWAKTDLQRLYTAGISLLPLNPPSSGNSWEHIQHIAYLGPGQTFLRKISVFCEMQEDSSNPVDF